MVTYIMPSPSAANCHVGATRPRVPRGRSVARDNPWSETEIYDTDRCVAATVWSPRTRSAVKKNAIPRLADGLSERPLSIHSTPAGDSHAGGGTRTPDTRIMIPLL